MTLTDPAATTSASPDDAAERAHLGVLAARAAARGGTLVFEGESFSTAELFARARRLSAGLRERGVAPGDRVVVLMANCPEVGIAYQALWWAAAVVTPVVFLVTAAELAHILTDSGAVAVVTTPEFAGKVTETGADVQVLVVGQPSYADAESGGGVDPDAVAMVPSADDDLAALLYTGGTTGRSKGVMLTHRNLYSIGAASHTHGYVPGANSALTALPLSHAYGLIVTVVGMHGEEPGLAVLQRWFDPAAFLALSAEHAVARWSVVPSMLQMLLSQPLGDTDLGALRYVTSGGSPLPRAVLDAFEAAVPGAQVLEGYGLTESAAVVASNPPGRRRVGSVGLPLPGVEVTIRDDAGAALPAGADGEVCVRSRGVMRGYWRSPEATASTVVDGELRTGDIGHLDADGYLFIVDRKKDLIIRGGFNVFPRDTEDALVTHPDITAAAVVGIPDAVLGEEVAAFVAVRPGATLTPAAVIDYAKTLLAAHKYPRQVEIVEAIPLTSVGKTDRKALRARLQG